MKNIKQRFYEQYPDLKGNQVVDTFLSKEDNHKLVDQFLNSPSKKRKARLDEAFRKHYFGIRFISYLNTSLYFHSINFDKKIRRFERRNILTLDQAIGDEEGATYKDLLVDQSLSLPNEQTEQLETIIENEQLLNAFMSLTESQKQILDLAYAKDLRDVEIAEALGTSQQNISKTHQKALSNLKDMMRKRKE